MAPLERVDELFTYAMARPRNTWEAEDLAQETYLRAIQAIPSWKELLLRLLCLDSLRRA
jgi:DNA-directed RNA polymerase specialized sigma24 family protein